MLPKHIENSVEEPRTDRQTVTIPRAGRNSRIGAVILLLLSVSLLVLSYEYPNIVVEVDSVVTFVSAMILLYKDTIHSIQLRVVDRILGSYDEQVSQLASLKFSTDQSYLHELKGDKISDVVIVPISREDGLVEETGEDLDAEQKEMQNVTTVRLVPPGRSLAELYMRELTMENPNLQDLASSMQSVFSESLGLSSASNMQLGSEIVVVKIAQPVLKSPCDYKGSFGSQYSLTCIACSLLAVLLCYTSKRSVSISKCLHDQKDKITTIEYRLGSELETKKEEMEAKQ